MRGTVPHYPAAVFFSVDDAIRIHGDVLCSWNKAGRDVLEFV